MSEAKHTAGPWHDDGYRIYGATESEDKRRGPMIVEYKHVDNFNYADAPLIAAAPDLLHELRHLVRLLEPLEREGTLNVPGLATLNGAREAIKKAEGK